MCSRDSCVSCPKTGLVHRGESAVLLCLDSASALSYTPGYAKEFKQNAFDSFTVDDLSRELERDSTHHKPVLSCIVF